MTVFNLKEESSRRGTCLIVQFPLMFATTVFYDRFKNATVH